MHRRRAASTLICILAALANVLGGDLRAATAASAAATEYEIKAAFLLHFSRFVEWPAGAFAAPEAPLLICVLGDDPFGPALEEIVGNEKVDSHPIAVERYRLAGNVDQCHILFVSRSAEPLQRRQILDQARGKSILTVSDEEGFTRRGGVIGLVTVNGKVKLQVNRASAERADLRISSRLLRLADDVG